MVLRLMIAGLVALQTALARYVAPMDVVEVAGLVRFPRVVIAAGNAYAT